MSLRELSDFDCEGQVARAQDVDNAVVVEPGGDVLIQEPGNKLGRFYSMEKI
jgi:hypothetical protein